MQQHEIQQFLLHYFRANGAEVIENTPTYLIVKLTVALDKTLMNRPFYWHYLEKVGGEPNPATLTLITDPTNVPDTIKGEIIHFGSPRLHQIFQSTNQLAGYIRLYENHNHREQTQIPLHPWLSANIKVSYVCDRKKDLLFSLGLHLLTGRIVENFHHQMLNLSLSPRIPDFSFTLSPIIMPKSGINRLDLYVRTRLQDDDHGWAERATAKWNEDVLLLEQFYEDQEEKGESYLLEKQALQEQYEPNINISIINGGMFYLNQQAL
ncbi:MULTISPECIES: YqhG family protein [Bacillus]|uniref:YqhG family protein n=1 Tax=Bacillus TaxID=1386 RepID=UPI0002EF24ED|nr:MULTISPECIES: YqhG family protein [Bacillus]